MNWAIRLIWIWMLGSSDNLVFFNVHKSDRNAMSISGYWFDPDSSTRREASLDIIEGGGYCLYIDAELTDKGQLSSLTVSDRLGDMPRRLTWPDDGLFETRDNDAVDVALSGSAHKGSRSLLIHRLESSWGWVVTALVVTVLFSYVGIRYGLPAASESIARSLPTSFNASVSAQALDALDRFIFEESETDDARQREVQTQFDELLLALPATDVEFTLHFRAMGGIANAMALPGGDVVVTDAFLDLIEHPEELDSVLLHEIGHVLEYHGMTQVIRSSALTVIVALAFGDLSAVGDIAVGVPIFIMQNSYSQVAESEADDFAFARMQEMGKDPKYFADIILRMSEQEYIETEADEESSYFSSHPDSQVRARKAFEASDRMQGEN